MSNPIRLKMNEQDREQRAAFRSALDAMGVTLTSSSSFERAFARTKDAADTNGEVSGERLRAIVDEVVSGMEMLEDVAESFR